MNFLVVIIEARQRCIEYPDPNSNFGPGPGTDTPKILNRDPDFSTFSTRDIYDPMYNIVVQLKVSSVYNENITSLLLKHEEH
jgi:hypothetical protein